MQDIGVRGVLLIVLIGIVFLEGLSWWTAPMPFPCLMEPEHKHEAPHQNAPEGCPTFLRGLTIVGARSVDLIERNDKAIVALFTIVLGISTIGLWQATVQLYRAGERQMELIAANASDQSRDMQETIKAARDSNLLTREIFTAEQRPWLRWTIPPLVTLEVNGPRLTAEINGTLQNIGRIPASNISYFGRLYAPAPDVAAITLGQTYFAEHMADLQNSGAFPLATILPNEKVPMNFGPTGVEVEGLPDEFLLFLAFHARYQFAVGGQTNPSTMAEIGTVYMVQAIGQNTLRLNKKDIIAGQATAALTELYGARCLT